MTVMRRWKRLITMQRYNKELERKVKCVQTYAKIVFMTLPDFFIRRF